MQWFCLSSSWNCSSPFFCLRIRWKTFHRNETLAEDAPPFTSCLSSISSRSYFSFQCISFQMREASEFPLIPIGCEPWQYNCVRLFSSKYSFPGFCCPGSSDSSRNIFMLFYYNMAKFFLSTGQLSHERNYFIFSNFVFILFLFSTALFYCYSRFLVFFHFYLDFHFSYLCDAFLTVLNFSFLFCILWIFTPFYLFYNFHFLFTHNILTFANCKPPFSMISYMLY